MGTLKTFNIKKMKHPSMTLEIQNKYY